MAGTGDADTDAVGVDAGIEISGVRAFVLGGVFDPLRRVAAEGIGDAARRGLGASRSGKRTRLRT